METKIIIDGLGELTIEQAKKAFEELSKIFKQSELAHIPPPKDKWTVPEIKIEPYKKTKPFFVLKERNEPISTVDDNPYSDVRTCPTNKTSGSINLRFRPQRPKFNVGELTQN